MKKLCSLFSLLILLFSCCSSPDLVENNEGRLEIDSVIDSKKDKENKSDSIGNNDSISNNEDTLHSLTFSILGNSISTYKGYIPNGYKVYYNENKLKLSETWWMIYAEATGYKLNRNASWSGSTVTNNSSINDSYFTSERRLSDLAGETVPDMIFVLGGTNDWHTAKCPLGLYPSDDLFDKSTFRGAYAYLVYQLHKRYPNTIVFCCSILPRKEGMNVVSSNNDWTITEGNESIKNLAEYYGAYYVDLSGCGLDADFTTNTLDGLHPTAKGMRIVANELYKQTNAIINDFYQ